MEKNLVKRENITNFLYCLEFLMKYSHITEVWLLQDFKKIPQEKV